MKPSIEEIIQQAENIDNVEIIEVPFPGHRRVLLRVKEMPEFAFFVWAQEFYVAQSDIVFCMPNNDRSKKYMILCARCSSEVYGLPAEDKSMWKWQKEVMRPKFTRVVLDTCHKHGVATLFMCHAEAWKDHYGVDESLQVVEASEHREAMQALYDHTTIRKALRFIDYDLSSGME